MGYCYRSSGTIVVKAEHLVDALAAINALHADEALLAGAQGGSWGLDSENHPVSEVRWYSWVTNPPLGGFKTLMEAFDAWRIFDEVDEACHDEEGNFVYSGFVNNKLGQEDIFLEAIAPLCKDTIVRYSGEDGSLWCWKIQDGILSERSGKIVYD